MGLDVCGAPLTRYKRLIKDSISCILASTSLPQTNHLLASLPPFLPPFLPRSEFKASIHVEYQKLEKELSNMEKVLTDRHLTRRELMEQRVSVLQVRKEGGTEEGGTNRFVSAPLPNGS